MATQKFYANQSAIVSSTNESYNDHVATEISLRNYSVLLGFDTAAAASAYNVITNVALGVYVVNQQGQYLLSQRHPKKQYPLYWECTGGSVLSGETSLQGAIREVKEELGILLTPGSEKLIYQSRRENVQDFYDVCLFHKDIKIEEMRLQETEVVDVQWVNPDKLFEMFRLKHLHPLITYVDQLIG